MFFFGLVKALAHNFVPVLYVSACSAAAGVSRAAGAMITSNLAVVRHVLVQDAKEQLFQADGCPTEFQLHSKLISCVGFDDLHAQNR